MNISGSRLREFFSRVRITPDKKREDFALNGWISWAVGDDTFIRIYHVDIVVIKFISLILCVLVDIVYEVVVITILGYCPLMS